MQRSLFAGDGDEHLDVPGAEVELHRGAVAAGLADRSLRALIDRVDWRQDHLHIMGRDVPLPRLTAWFGDEGSDYTYSGITMPARPWITPLLPLREIAERIAGEHFNSVLCNLYRSGNDGLAWHSDDESELGPEPVIASVNLGQPRRFVVRRRDDHSVKGELLLGHGDVLIMRGATQALCEHAVPKTKKPVGPRVNLTFRRIRV